MADARPRPPAYVAFGPERIDGPRSRSISFDPLASAQPAAAPVRRTHPPFEVEDVDPPVDFEPIARTKITPAPVRPDTLHRGRLLDWLERRTRRRLSFVVANAGYGKTTLLADFTERTDQRCLWFRLDPTDGDWVTFLNYLTAAFQAVDPGFGRATYSLFSQVPVAKPTLQAAISAFMADVSSLPDEPLILILDDYHVVDEAPDVAGIIGRLLKDAPPAMHFVIASRREPELPTARLRAHGDVATIDSTDLRFTRDELETLFADGFGQPLEADLLDMLDRRTEGWAACIQLLQSTLREMRAVEVRRFIEHLSVTEGPVYDYLAQEVLREARPDMRAFLLRSSILDPVVPAYVVAAMAEVVPPPSEADIRDLIRRAYEVGLLSRRDVSSGTFRFHPLLREFLESQLRVEASPADVAAAHRRVARLAEPDDWLTACRHFLAAGDQATSVRLLDRSVLTAVGTGAWGQAAALVADLGGAADAPDVQVIVAMDEIESGRLADAIARLEAIDRAALGPQARALVRHGLLRAYYLAGDLDAASRTVEEVLADRATPQLFEGLAEAHRLVFSSGTSTTMDYVAGKLGDLVQQHEDAELSFFAAVSLHNLMMAHLYRADYRAALEAGSQARDLFEACGRSREAHSTHAVMAVCSAELGREGDAHGYADRARADLKAGTDGWEPLAYLALTTGDESYVGSLAGALVEMSTSSAPPAAQAEADSVRRLAAIVRPDLMSDVGPDDQPFQAVGFGSGVEAAAIRAISGFLRGGSDTQGATISALGLARTTGSTRWAVRLEVLAAVEDYDASRYQRALAAAATSGQLALTDIAEVVVEGLALTSDLPREVAHSIRQWPHRWLPALRRAVSRGYGTAAVAAARALDEMGELSDVPLLRAFDRTYMRGTRMSGIGRALVNAKSPTVEVHDLGRSFIRVEGRTVSLSSVRRRAAALLYFLISRPTQTATRDQIMEALWSELVPRSGANSLNQTLYFLRREFDPYFDEDESYEYLSNRGDLVCLDQSRVRVSSLVFAANAALATRNLESDPAGANRALRSYTGRFAAEFEYEDWAQDWRDQLHSSFLHLGRSLQRMLTARGALAESIELAHFVLSEDPRALEIERGLIWSYAASDSGDAASAQYQHFAATYREAFAAPAPSFADVVRSVSVGEDREVS